MSIKLSQIKKAHLVGIKGTGMSALALALSEIGIEVTGSDTPTSFFLLDRQRFANLTVIDNFDKNNLPPDTDVVIASTSHITNNPEVEEGRRRDLPIFNYGEMIGLITRTLPTYAICGSHGKTTTSNLLGWLARSNNIPALVISGPTSPQVLDTELNTEPKGFILEADEYQNKLALYQPHGVILTNVELDHPDFFKTDEDYEQVFCEFVAKIPSSGFLIYWADSSAARRVAESALCKKIGYGFNDQAKYRIKTIRKQRFAIIENDTTASEFETNMLGEHNLLNAAAAILAARELGLDDSQIAKSLALFQGAIRRLQKVGEKPLIIDDYGHHPTEIKATITALREAYTNKKMWVVFHPHTFSRTKKFLKEFGQSFNYADEVLVLDIFGSAREKRGDLTSSEVVNEISKNGIKSRYTPKFEDASKILNKEASKDDLILTIGAGDVWRIHKLINVHNKY